MPLEGRAVNTRARIAQFYVDRANEATGAARLLRRARELLVTEGWTQRKMWLPWQGYCLLGAISWAALEEKRGRLEWARRLARRGSYSMRKAIMDANDAPGRTLADVLRVLDVAIERLERGEA